MHLIFSILVKFWHNFSSVNGFWILSYLFAYFFRTDFIKQIAMHIFYFYLWKYAPIYIVVGDLNSFYLKHVFIELDIMLSMKIHDMYKKCILFNDLSRATLLCNKSVLYTGYFQMKHGVEAQQFLLFPLVTTYFYPSFFKYATFRIHLIFK